MRYLLIGLLAASMLLVGCARPKVDTVTPTDEAVEGTTGVRGRIAIMTFGTVVPTDAPEQPSSPAENYRIAIFDVNSKTYVAYGSTDSEGNFEVALPPGQYRLDHDSNVPDLQSRGGPRREESTFTIVDEWVTLDLVLSSYQST